MLKKQMWTDAPVPRWPGQRDFDGGHTMSLTTQTRDSATAVRGERTNSRRPGPGTAGTPGFSPRAGWKVSQPGDAGERQAERIAEAVMSPGGCTGCTPVSPCASCASGIQRAADGAAPESASLPGLGSGRPLDASSRDFFEPRFGRDLGAVRVHDGPREGNDGAIAGGARLTLGNDIVFAPGRHEPGSDSGAGCSRTNSPTW